MSQEKKRTIKIVGICGSIREGSYTKMALSLALKGIEDMNKDNSNCTFETEFLTCEKLFLCDGLPNQSNKLKSLSSEELSPLKQFHASLESADGIILATPEYHGGFSGVLKNALDLCSFKQFENKIVGLIGVSGGAMGCINGLENLRTIGRALHCWVIPQQCAIPQCWKVFDSKTGQIKNEFKDSYGKRLNDIGTIVAKYSLLHGDKCLDKLMDSFIKGQNNFGMEKEKQESKNNE